MKFDVVCFGSAMVDAFVETHTKESNGNLMIPYGCKQLMGNLSFQIGGGGTNTAVAFSRLGLRTGYIGKIGKDANGKAILDILKDEKIIFLGKQSGKETSGFSVVLISKDRHRSILAYKGINDDISERDVNKFETDWMYLSSMMKESFKTQLKIAKKLKSRGAKIAFNPSEYIIEKENLNPLLKITDVLIVNKEESKLLTKEKDALVGIQKKGPRTVVITDGGEKIECISGAKRYELSPRKIKGVDKTGAGDAFAAGFVAGLIRNKPIEFCMRLGVKEAGSVIRHIGAKNDLIRMKLK